ncbi:MAG: hypothetical protein AAF608_13360 [Pseudomonadota bacterium]
MPNDKSPKKTKKDSQLVIRLHREERDRFVELCDELDTSAAREIRRFIKSFLKEHDESGGSPK